MDNIKKAPLLIIIIAAAFLIFSVVRNNQSIEEKISPDNFIELTFINNSGETSTDFLLYFLSTTTPISIYNIQPNDSHTESLSTKDLKDNDSLYLYYYDYNNEKIEHLLLDSLEKDSSGSITVDIVDIHENGVHELEIY